MELSKILTYYFTQEIRLSTIGEIRMRSKKQVYDTILNFARMNERIRVVTLEGSRTNINIPPDDFQDYDITFFVTDMQSFINDDNWLNVFGERLILQKPEDMELFPAVEKGFSYLMLFTDDHMG